MTSQFTFTEKIKEQRLLLASALIVAVALIMLGGAPIVPTLLGCLVVIVWAFVRG